jgi:predicted short-subunit dehydrogenase-like oxidoreductase (DUF2520 family)
VKPTHRRFAVSLIGAGKVGTALAVLLHKSGHKIVAIVSRKRSSARACGALVSCRNCTDDLAAIPSSTDLIIIAVPDQEIRKVAVSIAKGSHRALARTFVCHTSGALSSDVLKPLSLRGAKVFSFHPAQTFPRNKSVKDQIESMRGITYGVEGKGAAVTIARQLARQLDGEFLLIPKEAKILYHLVCVIASNYSVALVGAMAEVAGRFTRLGTRPFTRLLETSLNNALRLGAGKALTGPIVRGDAEIVAAHLKSIKDPRIRSLYKSLGAYTLELAARDHTLTNRRTRRLQKLLK